jgi:plastocyanin
MMRSILACSLLIASGCGGDDGGGNPDASRSDAAARNVVQVSCSGSPPLVTTPGLMFSPMTTTISVNGMVHFQLGATHNVVSTTTGEQFSLALGADTCLQFKAAKTYTFKCGPHNFPGSVVVQ